MHLHHLKTSIFRLSSTLLLNLFSLARSTTGLSNLTGSQFAEQPRTTFELLVICCVLIYAWSICSHFQSDTADSGLGSEVLEEAIKRRAVPDFTHDPYKRLDD